MLTRDIEEYAPSVWQPGERGPLEDRLDAGALRHPYVTYRDDGGRAAINEAFQVLEGAPQLHNVRRYAEQARSNSRVVNWRDVRGDAMEVLRDPEDPLAYFQFTSDLTAPAARRSADRFVTATTGYGRMPNRTREFYRPYRAGDFVSGLSGAVSSPFAWAGAAYRRSRRG